MRRLALALGLGLGLTGLLQLFNPVAIAAEDKSKSIYISPADGSYPLNGMFAVDIRSNSGSTPVNAIQVTLTYSNEVQFMSVSGDGSSYDIDAQKSGGGGTVMLSRGSNKPLSGDQLVAKVSFKVISTGIGNLTIDGAKSKLVSAVTHQNIATTYGDGDYILVPATVGKAAAPIPSSYPIPTPGSGSSPNVSISSNDKSSKPTILPDESEINVSQPSTIETTPSDEKSVQKVEYYINGKLAITVNEPPYSYSVNTTELRNGKYRLTTKTYYTDGSNDSADSVLNVSNPLSGKQLGLQLRHYAWLIILVIIATGVFIYVRFLRPRNDYGDGYDESESVGAPLSSVGKVPPSQPYGQNDNPNDPRDPYGRS